MTEPSPQPRRPMPAPAPEDAPRIVAVVGPTASGKSELALALARGLRGELISADSQQIYRGLDVGTAKPTPDERRAVRHHLLDVADPRETLSAGEFARLAEPAIADIAARGALPIIVGGTGLWLRALLLGLVETPPADLQLRERLAERARREGPEALHAELARIDPETAAATPAANVVRVVRALELHALTGEPPSVLRARHGFARLRYQVRVIGLSPPREELNRRIEARARAMFEHGLVEEVRGLAAAGLRDAPALKALGYPQALAVVEGRATVEEAIAGTATATRRYAKRQRTWFGADPLVTWAPWPPDCASIVEELRRAGFAVSV